MATFSEIKTIRLAIHDPDGYINFTEVTSLPTTAVHQTAHKLDSDGVYYATESSGAVTASDYEKLNLYVSDATLEIWIDDQGATYAKCQALKSIISALGTERRLKAAGAGAERTEFTELSSLLTYYKELLAICEDEYKKENSNNSGKIGTMKQPTIAGGNL
jgi:hypothetical protein